MDNPNSAYDRAVNRSRSQNAVEEADDPSASAANNGNAPGSREELSAHLGFEM